MDNIWDLIPQTADKTHDMADDYDRTLGTLKKVVKEHHFSTKEKADLLAGPVHGDEQEAQDQGHHLADIFWEWRQSENPVTLPELLLLACDYFDIDYDNKLFPAALTACVLGEIPHDNPYHDNYHFREVFAVMMRFCAHHNVSDIAPNLKFSKDDILLMLIGAAIHDFVHDGTTNFENNVYEMARLEKKSAAMATPFLLNAGLSQDQIDILELMIICTDTSRNAEGRSPAGISRDIYLSHEHGTLSMLVVPEDFQRLIDDHKLALMTRMLCEADITPSSGINYMFSRKLTLALSKENPAILPAATTLYVFMEVICHGGYDTPSAKALLGDKFKDILQAVRNDSVNGVLYS